MRASLRRPYSSSLAVVAASVLLLAIPLYLWRLTYPLADWAALFLAPLTVMLLLGFGKPRAAMLHARYLAAVRSDSKLAAYATGRTRAFIESLVFVVVTVPMLAWQALTVNSLVAPVLVVLCAAASGMALGLRRWLNHHLCDPYSTAYGASFAALIGAVCFVPLLWWINWNYVTFPGEFRSMGFLDAVQFGVTEELPPRRGWIAEILALFYSVESMQLWLTTRYGTANAWVPAAYGLYLALVAFLVARTSTALACFAQEFLGEFHDATTNK